MNIEKDLKRYKLKTDESGKLYDPIRQIFVPATPEEYVRQRMIKYLIGRMKVPAEKIVVEQGLVKFGVNDEADKKKRIDIGFYGDYNDLAAIIECKAYSIKDKEAPYAQARSYVRSLKIPAYFVTDGVLLEGYNYYYETDQFVKMDRIPMYEELCV